MHPHWRLSYIRADGHFTQCEAGFVFCTTQGSHGMRKPRQWPLCSHSGLFSLRESAPRDLFNLSQGLLTWLWKTSRFTSALLYWLLSASGGQTALVWWEIPIVLKRKCAVHQRGPSTGQVSTEFLLIGKMPWGVVLQRKREAFSYRSSSHC